jgi:hypothetical protein
MNNSTQIKAKLILQKAKFLIYEFILKIFQFSSLIKKKKNQLFNKILILLKIIKFLYYTFSHYIRLIIITKKIEDLPFHPKNSFKKKIKN